MRQLGGSTLAFVAVLLGCELVFGIAQAQTQENQGELEETFVTARRQREALQSTPVAVSVLKQEAFDRKGDYSPLTLATEVPSFHAMTSTSGTDSFILSMRGQSQTSFTLFPSINAYYSEVPLTKGLSQGQFFDLESIQVLRGAQGVRFGRVTDGGAILISPKRPGEEFGGFLQAKLGNYALNEYLGAINIPVVKDKLLLRAAFDVNRRDGYTTNLLTGRDLDDVHYETGRIGLIIRPTERLENYTSVQYQHIDQNGYSHLLTDVRGGSLADLVGLTPALALQKSLGIQATYNGSLAYGPDAGIAHFQENFFLSNITTLEVNDHLSFKNIFGFTSVIQRIDMDNDGTALQILDSPNLVNGQRLPLNQQHQWTEEFQAHGNMLDKALDWTIGFYADQQKPTQFQGFERIQFRTTDQFSFTNYKATSRAVYGSLEYDLDWLLQGLKINGGVRYTKDKSIGETVAYALPNGPGNVFPETCRTGPNISVPGGIAQCVQLSQESTATTWEVGATYQAKENLFFYVAGRRGYRPGGFQTIGAAPIPTYQPEFTQEVELGMKADWHLFGMEARTNVAMYRSRITNAQKVESPNINGLQYSLVINAAALTVKGIEFEGTLVPVPGLTLGLNYSYTDGDYDKDPSQTAALFSPINGICNNFTRTPSPLGALGFCPENSLYMTPEHQGTVSLKYELPLDESIGSVSFGGEWNYQTAMSLNDANFAWQGAFSKPHGELNVHASWDQIFERPFDLTFFMTNALDVSYYTSAIALGKVGFSANGYNTPRMYGFSLRYRFGSES